MNPPSDFFSTMMKQWQEGVKVTASAMQQFIQSFSGSLPGQAGTNGNGNPFQAFAANWSRVAQQMSMLSHQYLQGVIRDLPEVTRRRVDLQTFSQLARVAGLNWEEEVRRLSEAPFEAADRLGNLDRTRLDRLLQSMVTEYTDDLKAIKPDAFQIDLRPLADAWAKVLTGVADEDASKMVARFVEALAVKTRYGGEYYADPDKVAVGQTPRDLVHRLGSIELYRYRPVNGSTGRRGDPVLIVYSIINKSYIEDLLPGFSFVEHLLGEGLDVYMVEWGETQPGDRVTTLDSYIDPGLTSCVDFVREQTGAERVSLFGHCIGGNLALMHAAQNPDDVSRLITLTTPGTSAEGGVVALWTDRDVFPVDDIIDTYGHMPAKLIRYTFMALKPYYEVMKYKMFLENLGDDRVMSLFYPVDRWANENVDIPGEVFRKFIHELFHEERFRRGETHIGGRPVDLGAITCPYMNLAATRDWIVPLPSARILNDLVGSKDSRFVAIEGAHVGVMIDPRSRHHWTEMSDFLLGE